MRALEILPEDIAVATRLSGQVGNNNSGASLAAEFVGHAAPAAIASEIATNPDYADLRQMAGDLVLGAALARQELGLQADGERG